MILLYYSSKDRSLVIATFSVYSLICREVAGVGWGEVAVEGHVLIFFSDSCRWQDKPPLSPQPTSKSNVADLTCWGGRRWIVNAELDLCLSIVEASYMICCYKIKVSGEFFTLF